MTTLKQIIYDLWESIRANISDDDVLDYRNFVYFVNNQRALWLRNELNKGHSIDPNIIQDLGAVELEIDDSIASNEFIQDKKILRTVNKIPVTIERHDKPTITRIGPLNYRERGYSIVDYFTVPYVGNGKFNKNQIYTFIRDGYVYVVSDCNNPKWKTMRYINIQGVFEDPTEVAAFNTSDGIACYDDDSAYPINKWMIPYLKDAILKADLRQFIRPIDDEKNDANSNLTQFVTNKDNNDKREK